MPPDCARRATGTAKVMVYEDLMEAERERDNKKAAQEAGRGRGRAKQNKPASQQILGKRSRSQELEEEINKIEAGELKMYCALIRYNRVVAIIHFALG